MTPEAQRIAIAEACGWRGRFMTDVCAWRMTQEIHGIRPDGVWYPLPDYLADLNAMHEAEKVLTLNQWVNYIKHLSEITGAGAQSLRLQQCRLAISATAAQRAEAFLRTIGKWEEDKP